MIAATVSFPLILEYVTRNQLGTANAGIQLFEGLIRNGFSMFIGFYVLWWSLFFLPQAGDRIEIVLERPVDRAFVVQILSEADLNPAELDIRALHRLGTEAPESARWELRRGRHEAAALHKERKDLTNAIGKINTRLQSPFLKEERTGDLLADRSRAQARLAEIDQALTSSAEEFREKILSAMGPFLFRPGEQLLGSGKEQDYWVLEVQVVEQVTEEIARQLEIHFDAVDLALVRDPQTGDFNAALSIEPLHHPVNGLRLRLRRDDDFVVVERALLDAGFDRRAAFTGSSEVITILRGLLGQAPEAFTVSEAVASAPNNRVQLRVQAPVNGTRQPYMIADALSLSRFIESATVGGEIADLSIDLQFVPSLQRAVLPPIDTEVMQRIVEFLPDATDYMRHSLYSLYERLVPVAASAPAFLTVARPLVAAGPADRRYDYFFSVQFFMILTDVLGLLVIVLIVWLDRRGVIHRVGAHEDDNR
ncbi:MAG: hypothetical protein LR015_11080 [Verrucomicrobia bacterium]|nr:hypothetical protein [Verrucomicrobiota bacterium]